MVAALLLVAALWQLTEHAVWPVLPLLIPIALLFVASRVAVCAAGV
jgi:hypothetical protein